MEMSERVLGVVAGNDLEDAVLARWATSATRLYGADGGGARLCRMGFRPVVVGDFDSAELSEVSTATQVVIDPSQDRTDCDKLLRQIARDGHERATLVGIEGDRLDHVLASLGSALRSPLDIRLALRTGLAWVVREGRSLDLDLRPGTVLSLLPLSPCSEVCLSGARWPLDRAALSLDGQVSVSNVALGPVTVSLREGAALLVAGVQDDEVPLW